jgi:hypothetical protein
MGLPARNRTENGMIHHLIEYQWRKDNRKKKYVVTIHKII